MSCITCKKLRGAIMRYRRRFRSRRSFRGRGRFTRFSRSRRRGYPVRRRRYARPIGFRM